MGLEVRGRELVTTFTPDIQLVDESMEVADLDGLTIQWLTTAGGASPKQHHQVVVVVRREGKSKECAYRKEVWALSTGGVE